MDWEETLIYGYIDIDIGIDIDRDIDVDRYRAFRAIYIQRVVEAMKADEIMHLIY